MSDLTLNKNPKVSIVTVVFNASDEIEVTLKSITSQSFLNKEIIVIDGASTDGTRELIQKYLNKIDCFISEKDNGIYDAMNKGIKHASGDWICFMNAGDKFFNKNTIKELFEKKDEDDDILAGDCIADYNSFTKYIKAKNLNKIKYGMIFSHQAVFVKTNLYKRKYFDLKFKIASDFNFFYWCYLSNVKFKIINSPVSIISTGGLSDNMKYNVFIENRKIIRQYSEPQLIVEIIYLIKIFWAFMKYLIEKILPEFITNYIRRAV